MNGVMMLTRDTPFGRHMAARMAATLSDCTDPLTAILVIETVSRPRARPSRAARLLRLRALKRLVSRKARQNYRVWQFQQEAGAEFSHHAGAGPDWPASVRLLHVPECQVNAADSIDWLRQGSPRLLVVAGSPILSADLLAVPTLGVLNMHSSLLPRYRGTRAEFWQVHNNEMECAGITIHFVDTSVDGGDIVRHHPLHPTPGDSPWLMRARNQLNGLRVYPETVRAVLEGRGTRTPQPPVDERAYRYSDITPAATRTVLHQIDKLRRSRG